MTTYTGWHFLADPTKLAHNGGPVPPVGESVSIDGDPILCERGFHASKRALAALYYAPGPWVERVRLEGVVVVGDNKAVGTRRVSLTAPVNVHTLLVRFAADEAERVLPIFEAAYPGDGRPRKAIEAVRAWASCPCEKHRRAANAAANAAADAAASAANAYYAADAAHYAAAYATAYAAAHGAAHYAANAANDAAAYAANAAATRVRQERTLARLLREALK